MDSTSINMICISCCQYSKVGFYFHRLVLCKSVKYVNRPIDIHLNQYNVCLCVKYIFLSHSNRKEPICPIKLVEKIQQCCSHVSLSFVRSAKREKMKKQGSACTAEGNINIIVVSDECTHLFDCQIINSLSLSCCAPFVRASLV